MNKLEKILQNLLATKVSLIKKRSSFLNFIAYSENSLMTSGTFSELLMQEYFEELNSEEKELLKKYDLFGFLGLTPENARHSTNIANALENRKHVNLLYKLFAEKVYAQVFSNEFLSFRESLLFYLASQAQYQNRDLIEAELSAWNLRGEEDLIKIVIKFTSEVQQIILDIDSIEELKILQADLNNLMLLAQKILLNQTLHQRYEDLWSYARAYEQSPKETEMQVDQLSFISKFRFDKNFLQDNLMYIGKYFPFDELNEHYSLKEEFKPIIQKALQDFLNEQEDKTILIEYLKLIADFSEGVFYSIYNLAGIYLAVRNKRELKLHNLKGEMLVISYERLIIIPEITKIDKLITELEILESPYANLLEFIDIVVDKIDESSSQDKDIIYFKDILFKINHAVNILYLMELNIFGKGGVFNFFVNFYEIIPMLYSAYATNIENIFERVDSISVQEVSEKIANRLETHFGVKISKLKELINKSDEELAFLRQQRNNSLLKIIRRDYSLSDVKDDHQGFVVKLFKSLMDQKILPFSPEEFAVIFLIEDQPDKVFELLEYIADDVALKYGEVIRELEQKGYGVNFNIIDVMKNEPEDSELKTNFVLLQNFMMLFKYLGFQFIPTSKSTFVAGGNYKIFEQYVSGWQNVPVNLEPK